jgi:hypothetical protein
MLLCRGMSSQSLFSKYISTSHIRWQTLLSLEHHSYYISHETRKEQQNATSDLKPCTSIVHGQHDNFIRNCGLTASKPLFTLTRFPHILANITAKFLTLERSQRSDANVIYIRAHEATSSFEILQPTMMKIMSITKPPL